MHELDSKRKTCIVQTAPATRIAIGEEFGFESGSISTGRMVSALHHLGFDLVFDTNFAADLTIMEEANEFLHRVENGKNLPLFTSCCPGWVNFVEKSYPELIPHLSTTKSPQQMHGAVSRLMYGHENVFVCAVMPCTAKKGEANRPGMQGDVDAVITTRELARMIRARRIPFASLPNEGKNECSFDSPLGESTGAGQIFGASGGVMEAALRTAVALKKLPIEEIDFHQVRGMGALKEATVPGLGKVCVVNGISSCIDLFNQDPSWYKKYLMIEVMACPGGCLNGGGEPKAPKDSQVIQKRMTAIYNIDSSKKKRKSNENQEVQKLYEKFSAKPFHSVFSEQNLHTYYADRKSPRHHLALFLNQVDLRDGKRASELFSPRNAIWKPSDRLELKGREAIQKFIEETLPKQKGLARHKFMDSSSLKVLGTNGIPCEFEVQLDEEYFIKSLIRTV